MRLVRPFLLGVLLASAGAVGVSGCSYDPHPIDGSLRCSSAGECPEGYSCETNLCWSKDNTLADPLRRYLGKWTIATSSTVVTSCDDGYTDTRSISPDASKPSYMTLVVDSAKVGIDSTWLCQLHLTLDAAGAHLDDANPACTDDTQDPKYTWTAGSFDVLTTNGTSATHSAYYNRTDEYDDGTVVNCDQTVTATMSK